MIPKRAAAKVTVPGVRDRGAGGGRKLVSVTAYDAPTASLLDGAGVDIVLVGDSVGNVILGYDSTIPVTMKDMLHHVRAVYRGLKRALLVADMPFLSYQSGVTDAIRNAGRFIKEGADAVKLEGGIEVAGTIKALTSHGIPVMGHVGLMPQKVREYGGYAARGKSAEKAFHIWRDARAVERAGAFSIVLESIPVSLARIITGECACATIGIGAGPHCDGQVLVFNDLVGLTPAPPRFAKAYAHGHKMFRRAVSSFIRDVRRGSFPRVRGNAELPEEEMRELEEMIKSLPDK